MKRWVFFSWQSDLPKSRHWTLIEDALNLAARTIRKDESIEIDPVIDRDTAGKAGAPDISDTIFAKIDRSHVFVADVSIINSDGSAKASPNPNVLFELGYAVRALGWDRVLLTMNLTSGDPNKLPFDIRGKRVITYKAQEEPPAAARKQLAGQFEMALQAIFAEIDKHEVDYLVLALAGDVVRVATENFTNSSVLLTYVTAYRAAEMSGKDGLQPGQIEESMEVLVSKGYLKLHDFAGATAYTFTVRGFYEYALKYIPHYKQFLTDIESQIVTSGTRAASDIRKALNKPPALVKHALEFLEDQELIQLAKGSGSREDWIAGIRIITVSAALNRKVREAGG